MTRSRGPYCREEAEEREVAEVTLQQRRSWVALSAIPVVYGAEDVRAEAIAHGTDDLALELQNPPCASYLALPEGLLPDARLCGETDSLPYIIAAVPGVLLVRTTDLARGRGAINPVDFLSDVRSGTATRLPAVPAELSTRSLPPRRSLGLVADPRSPGHYVVAPLHRADGKAMGRHGALVCYSTANRQWAVKTLSSAPDHKRWGKHGAFAHGGLLCWVDIAYGMVICDPFEEHPNLRLVPRPPGSEKGDGPRSTTLMNQRRCIRRSQGVLRYMEIEGLSYSMWSLVNPAGPTHWKFEHKVPFSKIWEHQSYLNAGMPKDKIPSLALVDPDDHDVVYFFQDAWLFGWNMRAGEITAYEECCIVI
nr:unnamed protein product [Digitaria exilis]